jgi:saccharopine dehydrogenase-like NADP-dependent oxidoreductase
MKNTRVAILGAGHIGRAFYKILTDLSALSKDPYRDIDAFVIDSTRSNIEKLTYGTHFLVDLQTSTVQEIADILTAQQATVVINALPFSLNEKTASAAVAANCSYIDFTEDDVMADKVQKLFQGTNLNCAVKCGLAPGFINYIGYNLVDKIDSPDSLMISVGALPRNVSYDINHPEHSYNLTWSVDGLVNEYIRPCRIRRNGTLMEVPALSNQLKVVLDGVEFEAAYTSGGIGSLARDLEYVPNVAYMTLRYPGHFNYVRQALTEANYNFIKLRYIFLEKFPLNDDDMIVAYATVIGKDKNGTLVRKSYSNKFYGVNGLTGIQATTAGSGVAILELILKGKLQGIINHNAVSLADFTNTLAFVNYYKTGE